MFKRYMLVAGCVALVVAAAGCTDATLASIGSFGSKSKVTCYSGGQEIYKDESTGKVQSGQSGVYYKSSKTGRFVHTYADCIIEQEQ